VEKRRHRQQREKAEKNASRTHLEEVERLLKMSEEFPPGQYFGVDIVRNALERERDEEMRRRK
jgi:hypothetical protein